MQNRRIGLFAGKLRQQEGFSMKFWAYILLASVWAGCSSKRDGALHRPLLPERLEQPSPDTPELLAREMKALFLAAAQDPNLPPKLQELGEKASQELGEKDWGEALKQENLKNLIQNAVFPEAPASSSQAPHKSETKKDSKLNPWTYTGAGVLGIGILITSGNYAQRKALWADKNFQEAWYRNEAKTVATELDGIEGVNIARQPTLLTNKPKPFQWNRGTIPSQTQKKLTTLLKRLNDPNVLRQSTEATLHGYKNLPGLLETDKSKLDTYNRTKTGIGAGLVATTLGIAVLGEGLTGFGLIPLDSAPPSVTQWLERAAALEERIQSWQEGQMQSQWRP